MDHPPLLHLSLCTGYGGIDLGLKRVLPHLRTVAYCEREAFATANLVAKIESGLLDHAPVWTDLSDFPYRQFHGLVGILSAGFPCQPFSAAGRRRARDDERNLIPDVANAVRLCNPDLVFLENVEGILRCHNEPNPVLADVLCRLESLGYTATAGLYTAAEVGSPQKRLRVFILAHANSIRGCDQLRRAWSVALSNNGGSDTWPAPPSLKAGTGEPLRLIRKRSRHQSPLGGEADGLASELVQSAGDFDGTSVSDELHLIGNGAVPAVAALAFRELSTRLNGKLING